MKMILEQGIIGRNKAIKFVSTRRFASCGSIPEAVWRSDGRYYRAYCYGNGDRARYVEIPGDYYATATLTIADWYKRYAKH